jgi:phage baseplate assembly protein W
MEIFFPYQIDAAGATATTTLAQHVRDLIEQVLFTDPGERVNRPAFGAGVRQLVFGPAGDEIATTVEFLIRSALLQWLGDVIRLEDLTVTTDDATLEIRVTYIDLIARRRDTAAYTRALELV